MAGGGADNQTLELTAGLRDLGCDLTLAIATGSRWDHRARSLGVRVETFARESALKQAFIQRVAQIIRQQRIQVVHAHQGRDYWPAIIAARLAGCGARVVVTRHLMTRPRWFSRWGLLACAQVIAVSQAVLQGLQRELHGPAAHLHQIFCGIDLHRFQTPRTGAVGQFRASQGWGANDVVFGVVGAFGLPRGKGQLEFVQAAAKVHRDYAQARFAIIGDGEMGALLQEQIARLQLQTVVRVLPFTEEIVTAIQALDVLAHPAVGSEAFGLVILEAMACGKPVIASCLDGIPELFKHGKQGLLTAAGDVAALAEAIKSLLANPALRQRLGAAGRWHVARHFTREIMAEQTQAVYLKLCGLETHAITKPCHPLRQHTLLH